MTSGHPHFWQFSESDTGLLSEKSPTRISIEIPPSRLSYCPDRTSCSNIYRTQDWVKHALFSWSTPKKWPCLCGMVSYHLWGLEGFWRGAESKSWLSKSLQKLQVDIHFRLLFNEIQQHWPGTVVWAWLWCWAISHRPASCYHISHLSHLKIRLPQRTQAVTFLINSKNINWHRPLFLQTSTSPNGSMQNFGNNFCGMGNDKWVSGVAPEKRKSDLYGTLWVLSLYGWKSIFIITL